MRFILILTTLLSVSSLCIAGEQRLFVQSLKAKIMAKPSFGANVVGVLNKGTEVKLLENNKRWLKIETGTQSGWVSSFLISNHPPINKISVLGNSETKELEQGARRRASAVTTAGAARGLSADDRKRTNSGDKSDYYALEQMEDFRLSDHDVSKFIREGMGL